MKVNELALDDMKLPLIQREDVRTRSMTPSVALISYHGDPTAVIGFGESGGQNIYVLQIGKTLASLGWQVDIFTRCSDSAYEDIIDHDMRCRTIRLSAGPKQFIPKDNLFQYLPQFLGSFDEFCVSQNIHYPVVYTNYWLSGWIGLQLNKRNNIRLFHSFHSLGVVKYKSVSSIPEIAHARLEIERQILEKADCIVVNSPQEREYIRTLISKKGRTEIIPCGTENYLQAVSTSQARTRLKLSHQNKIVLCVARFDPRKGIETLVRACSKSKYRLQENFRLIIIGGYQPNHPDDDERQRIMQIVEDVHLTNNTLFVGQQNHDVLPLYYSAADVCVVPSHYEPFGLVAIEAMACGTPVIASDVGGLKFTVRTEKTGLLVPPKDIDAFAEAIERILEDKIWAKKLGIEASKVVREEFNLQENVKRLSQLFK